MRYLVCFDVSSGLRRNSLAKLCLEYGFRVQRSVFELSLEKDGLAGFEAAARKTINCETDSIRIYPMDQAMEKGLVIVGQGHRWNHESVIIL